MAVFRISPKAAVATVFVTAMFINILDATVVNVALPTIAAEFGVPLDSTATVNIGFLVAVAVAIPVAGWLGDRFGPREVFTLSIGLFTAASAACGLAGSIEQLVIFRIVQGIGGGLMTPVGMAMLYRLFPPAERVRLSRIITIPIAVAPAIGPVLGGLLVQGASWRWIFGLNVPIGVVAVAFTLLTVPHLRRAPRTSFDVAGFLLAAVGFAGLMFAVSEGPSEGWSSPLILACAGVGIALLVALVLVEGRVSAPMLRLELFAVRLFRASNIITATSAAGFLGALFVFPLMLQTAYGASPLQAGLLTFPEALGIMAGTQLAGRLYARVGPRRIIAYGQGLVTLVLVALAAFSTPDTPTVLFVVLMLFLGFGQAHTFVPTSAAAFDAVPAERTGAATALFNATRQVGSAFGVALAATVIAAVGVGDAAAGSLPAFRWAFVACACCTFVGSMVAVLAVRDADAAPSRGLVSTVPTRA